MGLHLENEVARSVVKTPTIILITLYNISYKIKKYLSVFTEIKFSL